MDLNDLYLPVLREVDLLIMEAATLQALGPRFVIVHRYCRGGVCLPGEEIAFVLFPHRSREIVLKISTTEKLLFEAFAQNRRFPQSATQIEGFLRTDPFFKRHGANALPSRLARRICRPSIPMHVRRLRAALAAAFAEAGLNLDPLQVLCEERAAGPLGYQLRATIEWRHLSA